ncbi:MULTISPECIES: NAD(P)H-dependent oxidoreductase [Sphingobacterium]|jgi:nitroreductase|uniref:NAD(P)H nitroreductase SAV2523 n=1 Tax=Sphingobacterium multivorum TaxID=28454 RepID=A0A2X2JK32_SPHMU|nr:MULTISPECIES: NAD(P)H-dependent oxidoreductase [Sphingobacterium]HAF33775.1 NAD(P)H-dependent oxidoreductase [Sphingobacterium sp.]OFV15226.1 NAD(P)H-dependent oxidoreductase [Sphingobacterium sp. HMSC13C05]QRQ62813.1 NAD(P)H-dependent oxidoreductase [Sphingobacterium multivorum]SPZ94278.1 Putative NAD(P)H nitroreductase SAV2523 [Sphingobacterium multivorum]HAK27745.1 NAD(P)H-dependent oxidoreductase [Sphingobacterium sp.]
MALLDTLEWRYATKKYDPTKKVAQEDLDKILEAARMAPSSSGLQQFRVIVITNQELKEKIVPVAWGQQIVADSSHLLVFAGWDRYTDERIDKTFDKMNTLRGLPLDSTDEYKNRLKGQLASFTEEQQAAHAAKQAYIAFGLAIAQAAELGVDATPMEGFSNAELDELLGLDKLGLKSAVMLPLGYRMEEQDWLLKLKKFRLPKEEFLIELA